MTNNAKDCKQNILSTFKKGIFAKIALVVMSISFAFLAMEVTLRIIDPIKFQSLIDNTTKNWQAGLPCEIYRPSKTLGYEFIPNLNVPKWGVKTNSFGMLDKERTKEKFKDIYRIICLGDSTTANSEYVSILERLLNEGKKQFGFEIWNCGVGGYNAIQYYRALKEKWLRYNPDMVIIGFCLNDFYTTPLIFRKGDGLEGYFPRRELLPLVSPFLLKHSALYRVVISKLIFSKMDRDNNLHEQIGLYLKEMKELLSERQINFLIVIIGLPQRYDNWPRGWKVNYKEIKRFIKEYDINMLDTVPSFEEKNPEGLKKTFGDDLHFNTEGSQIIAEAIYAYLKQNNMVINK
ncbi:MAG: SGNH/GDSL hydrolase family protein [Candidatus Omnitrophota bacterium]